MATLGTVNPLNVLTIDWVYGNWLYAWQATERTISFFQLPNKKQPFVGKNEKRFIFRELYSICVVRASMNEELRKVLDDMVTYGTGFIFTDTDNQETYVPFTDIYKNIEDLDPEFSKTVTEHYWDLI